MAQGLLPRYTSRFDIVDGYYWWLVHHHEGQDSAAYARMCRISQYFRPGPLATKPEMPDIYNALCDKAGCTHERLSIEDL